MDKNKDFPFGLQVNPGKPTAIGSLLYSLGLPVFSGGQTHNINQMMGGNILPSGMGGKPPGGAGDVVNFTPNAGRNRMRGGMMGLNYRLMR